jgi:hypothetical protein
VADLRDTELTALRTNGTRPTRARLGRLGRRLLRIVLVLIAAGAVGVGIYFGWPVVYDRYIRPVAANTADLTSLQQQVDQAVGRITEMESQLAAVNLHVRSLTGTEGDVALQLDQIATAVNDVGRRLDDLDAITAGLANRADESQATFVREVDILRSMELLSRARLFLYQANYGLAIQDLETARAVLAGIRDASDDTTISEALFRLDLALGSLPDRPVAASDDLDIAWQTLLGNLPNPTPTPAPSTPDTSSTSTSTTSP